LSDELLDGLRQAGAADSEGAFTVDRAAARRKLGAYRLASTQHWILPMVAHAVRCGGREIRFRTGPREWSVERFGPCLSRTELDGLGVVSDAPASPSLSHLVAALEALLALDADVEIVSGDTRLSWEGAAAAGATKLSFSSRRTPSPTCGRSPPSAWPSPSAWPAARPRRIGWSPGAAWSASSGRSIGAGSCGAIPSADTQTSVNILILFKNRPGAYHPHSEAP
jgi:hypothetical protein